MKKIVTLLTMGAMLATLMISCKANYASVEAIKPAKLFEEAPATNVLSVMGDAKVVTYRGMGGKLENIKAGKYKVTFTSTGSDIKLRAVSPWWSFSSADSVSPLEFELTDADVAKVTGEACDCKGHDSDGKGDLCFVTWSGSPITITGIEYTPFPAPAN